MDVCMYVLKEVWEMGGYLCLRERVWDVYVGLAGWCYGCVLHTGGVCERACSYFGLCVFAVVQSISYTDSYQLFYSSICGSGVGCVRVVSGLGGGSD